MNYRELGSTGLRVSEIALGCEGFNECSDQEAEKLFEMALEAGVNCMDLYTPNPTVHRRVAAALAGRRADFILQAHLCRSGKTDNTEQHGVLTRCRWRLKPC